MSGLTRRSFLKRAFFATAALTIPGVLKTAKPAAAADKSNFCVVAIRNVQDSKKVFLVGHSTNSEDTLLLETPLDQKTGRPSGNMILRTVIGETDYSCSYRLDPKAGTPIFSNGKALYGGKPFQVQKDSSDVQKMTEMVSGALAAYDHRVPPKEGTVECFFDPSKDPEKEDVVYGRYAKGNGLLSFIIKRPGKNTFEDSNMMASYEAKDGSHPPVTINARTKIFSDILSGTVSQETALKSAAPFENLYKSGFNKPEWQALFTEKFGDLKGMNAPEQSQREDQILSLKQEVVPAVFDLMLDASSVFMDKKERVPVVNLTSQGGKAHMIFMKSSSALSAPVRKMTAALKSRAAMWATSKPA